MTIPRTINMEALNERLGNMDNCAQYAPTRTFERAKTAHGIIGEALDDLIKRLAAEGFDVCNCDGVRQVEAVMYGWVVTSDPETFLVAEGFGSAMDTEAKDRVIANMKRDRDFIENMRRDQSLSSLQGLAVDYMAAERGIST